LRPPRGDGYKYCSRCMKYYYTVFTNRCPKCHTLLRLRPRKASSAGRPRINSEKHLLSDGDRLVG
jgi:hypothetical protein